MNWNDENTRDYPTSWDMDGQGTPFRWDEDIMAMSTIPSWALDLVVPWTNDDGELIFIDVDLGMDEMLEVIEDNGFAEVSWLYTGGNIPPPEKTDWNTVYKVISTPGFTEDDLIVTGWSLEEAFAMDAELDANRYFVGNGLNATQRSWDRALNWSTSTGGAGGAGVPTIADDVFLDANSGDCDLDIVLGECVSFTTTGYGDIFSTLGNTLDCDGAFNHAAGTVLQTGYVQVAGNFTVAGTWTCIAGVIEINDDCTWNASITSCYLYFITPNKTITMTTGNTVVITLGLEMIGDATNDVTVTCAGNYTFDLDAAIDVKSAIYVDIDHMQLGAGDTLTCVVSTDSGNNDVDITFSVADRVSNSTDAFDADGAWDGGTAPVTGVTFEILAAHTMTIQGAEASSWAIIGGGLEFDGQADSVPAVLTVDGGGTFTVLGTGSMSTTGAGTTGYTKMASSDANLVHIEAVPGATLDFNYAHVDTVGFTNYFEIGSGKSLTLDGDSDAHSGFAVASGGAFNDGGNTFTVQTGPVTLASGTYTATGEIQFLGEHTVSGAGLTFNDIVCGSSPGDTVYHNDVTIAGDMTINGGDTVTLDCNANDVALNFTKVAANPVLTITDDDSLRAINNTSNQAAIEGNATKEVQVVTGTVDWDNVSGSLWEIKDVDLQKDTLTGGGTCTVEFTGDCTIDRIGVGANDLLKCVTAGTTITSDATNSIVLSTGSLEMTGANGNHITYIGQTIENQGVGTYDLQYFTTSNDRDGISLEPSSTVTQIDNCVFATTDAARAGFIMNDAGNAHTITNCTFTGGDDSAHNKCDIYITTGAQMIADTCTYSTVGMQATGATWLFDMDGSSNATVYGILASSETPGAGYQAADITGDLTMSQADQYSSSFNTSYTLGANCTGVDTFVVDASTTFDTDSGNDYDFTAGSYGSVIGGTMNCNGSTISISAGGTGNASGLTLNSGGIFNGGSGNHTIGRYFNINDDCTFTSGTTTFDGHGFGYAFYLGNTKTITHSSGTVSFTYAGNQLLRSNDNTAQTLYNVILNKASGIVQYIEAKGFDLTVANDLTVTSGTLDTSETVSGTSKDLTVSGATIIDDTFLPNASIVTHSGGVTINATGTYGNDDAYTIDCASFFTMVGAATFSTPDGSGAMSVAGNLTGTATMTWTQNGVTTVLDGVTQTLTGFSSASNNKVLGNLDIRTSTTLTVTGTNMIGNDDTVVLTYNMAGAIADGGSGLIYLYSTSADPVVCTSMPSSFGNIKFNCISSVSYNLPAATYTSPGRLWFGSQSTPDVITQTGNITITGTGSTHFASRTNYGTCTHNLSTHTIDASGCTGDFEIGGQGVFGYPNYRSVLTVTTGSILVGGALRCRSDSSCAFGSDAAYTLDLDADINWTVGTFNAPDGSGTFTYSGTTWTEPANFNHDDGQVTFDLAGTTTLGAAATGFYAVLINGTATVLDTDSGNDYALTTASRLTNYDTLNCNGSAISIGSGASYYWAIGGGTLNAASAASFTVGAISANSHTLNLTANTTTLDYYTGSNVAFSITNLTTLAHNDGEVAFTYAGNQYIGHTTNTAKTLYDVTLNKASGTVQYIDGAGFALTVANDFTITSGTWNTFESDGANERNLTVTGATSISDTITLNASTCSFQGVSLVSATWNGGSGTQSALYIAAWNGGSTITMTSDVFTISSATGGESLALDPLTTWDPNGGEITFTSAATQELNFESNTQHAFYDLTVNKASGFFGYKNVRGADTLVQNDFTITSGSFTTKENGAGTDYALTVTGDTSVTGTATLNASTVIHTGNVTINGGGTYTDSTYVTVIGGNYSNAGTYTAGGGILSFTGAAASKQTITQGGDAFGYVLVDKSHATGGVDLQDTFTNTSTLELSDGIVLANAVTVSHGDLEIKTGTTYSATSTITTITSESAGGYAFNNDGTLTNNSGEIIFTYAGTTNVDFVGTAGNPYDVTVNHASCVIQQMTATTVGNDITVTAGEWRSSDGSPYGLTVTGATDVTGKLFLGDSTVFLATVTVNDGGEIDGDDSTVTVSGAAVVGGGTDGEWGASSSHDITLNSTLTINNGASFGTASKAYSLDLNGNMNTSTGTLIAPTAAGTFTFAGSTWNSPTTYTHSSGLIVFDGSGQTLNTGGSFYSFTKSVAAAEDLTFKAGATQTFSGVVTMNGASGQSLSLISDTPGTRWKISLQASATEAFDYVKVQDGDATPSDNSQIPIYPAHGTDLGNNLNWFSSYIDDQYTRDKSFIRDDDEFNNADDQKYQRD